MLRPHAALVQSIAPGGRLLRSRKLHGGIGSIVHRLDIERADGTRLSVSLRRSAPEGDHAHVTPEKAAYEFAALKVVRAAGVHAPEPILLDTEGEFFGVAAIVLAYVPGKPRFAKDDVELFARGMAGALIDVHSVTPERSDLSTLKLRHRAAIRDRIRAYRETAASDPFALEAHAVIEEAVERIELLPATLTHGDFWSGNVIWNRGRVSGIVDWNGAAVGDLRTDVAELRIDLTMTHGVEAADTITRAYENAAARTLPDLWFFDLFRGIDAYVECEHWLEGLWDLGMTHLTEEDVRGRLATLFRRGMASAVK